MGMFKNREPRRYRPVTIYTDERQERLQKLVDEVRRQQREENPAEAKADENKTSTSPASDIVIEPDRFRGKFINYTPHLQRHKERSRRFGWPLWIMLLFVMIILWRFLLR
jgi:hypothetical protein